MSRSPFHPLPRNDIKWKRYAFGRQEAAEQAAQLGLSFVQPAVQYMQQGLGTRSADGEPGALGRRRCGGCTGGVGEGG